MEEIIGLVLGWFGSLPDWIAAATTIVTAATAITMLTPTTADDRIVSGILKFLNVLSGNILKNKNADDA
jgi:hypothetical protein